MEDAIGLVLRVMSKTMDSTSLDSEKLEFATLTLNAKTGQPQTNIFKPNDIDRLLHKHGLAKPKDEDEATTTATGATTTTGETAMSLDS